MAYKMLQVALCSTLLIGALGAPFLLEDPANQFLHLKRHVYLRDFWDPDHSRNGWEITLADQVHETWTFLKRTAQHYLNTNTFTFDMSYYPVKVLYWLKLEDKNGSRQQDNGPKPGALKT